MSNYGPNVTRLIKKFIARFAVPPGGGVGDALLFFQDTKRRKEVLEKAETAAIEAIRVIKTAPDNPYGEDDEIIADALLKKVDEKEKSLQKYIARHL